MQLGMLLTFMLESSVLTLESFGAAGNGARMRATLGFYVLIADVPRHIPTSISTSKLYATVGTVYGVRA